MVQSTLVYAMYNWSVGIFFSEGARRFTQIVIRTQQPIQE